MIVSYAHISFLINGELNGGRTSYDCVPFVLVKLLPISQQIFLYSTAWWPTEQNFVTHKNGVVNIEETGALV
jgi:hypothetical protein